MAWIVVTYITCISASLAYLEWAPVVVHPILHGFLAYLVASLVIFVFSRALGNSSCYDASWSVLPPVFLLYWTLRGTGEVDPVRLGLLSAVVVYWAVRLTANWAIHWPGLEHEDWRYALLRSKAPRAEFLIDLFAVHIFPAGQVYLGLLPVYAVTHLAERPLNVFDGLAFAMGIAAVSLEWVADRQLHAFVRSSKPGSTIQSGVWSWSRHPNYFGEFTFWLSLACFGIAAHPVGWWWQGLGALAMLLMFVFASIPMMEQRSLERRSDYAAVQRRVSMFVPWPPDRG